MPSNVQTSAFQLFGDEGKQRLTFDENENTVVIAFLGGDGSTWSTWRKCTYERYGDTIALVYKSKKGAQENECQYEVKAVAETEFIMDGDWYEE